MASGSIARRIAGLLDHFPPVHHAFAYGSGVKFQPGLYDQPAGGEQLGHSSPTHPPSTTATLTQGAAASPPAHGPMVDLIFVVEDPYEWHRQNLSRNPSHYSWLSRQGPGVVSGVANHIGVGLHFNSLVPLAGQVIKYGTTSVHDLEDDLANWRNLYVAGRLHKPVLTLQESDRIARLQAANLRSATAAALLMLPPQFTLHDFLLKVCSLSYSGDIRMGLAEDPVKVERIVAGSLEELEAMYSTLLSEPRPHNMDPEATAAASSSAAAAAAASVAAAKAHVQPAVAAGLRQLSGKAWQQSSCAESRQALLRMLPTCVLHRLSTYARYNVPEHHLKLGTSTQHEILQGVVNKAGGVGGCGPLVAMALRTTVFQSSLYQTCANALAAGGGRALGYLMRKMGKAFRYQGKTAVPLAERLKVQK